MTYDAPTSVAPIDTTDVPPVSSRRTLLKGMTAGAAGLLFVGSARAAGSDVLLVKNHDPWSSDGITVEERLAMEGIAFTKITSSQFAAQDLSSIGLIATESSQDDAFYNDMYAAHTKLSNWVSGGGVLLGAVTLGGPNAATSTNAFLPGGVGAEYGPHDTLHILDSTHPTVSGLTDADVSGWNLSTHGYVTGLPGGATVIIERTDNNEAVLAEYTHGEGTVLAHTMTLEWSGADPRLLQQGVNYLADGAGYTPPEPEPEPEEEEERRGPMWEVADFTVSDRTPSVGQEVTIEVAIENVGDREGRYAGFLNDGFTRFGTTKRPRIDAGETATLSFSDTFDSPGTHRMFIRHDWVVDVVVSAGN